MRRAAHLATGYDMRHAPISACAGTAKCRMQQQEGAALTRTTHQRLQMHTKHGRLCVNVA
jgi:hypothetical protein